MAQAAAGGTEYPQAAHQHGHLRCTQTQQLSPADQQMLGGHAPGPGLPMAAAIGLGLHHGKGRCS